jgi:hypothetical protein
MNVNMVHNFKSYFSRDFLVTICIRVKICNYIWNIQFCALKNGFMHWFFPIVHVFFANDKTNMYTCLYLKFRTWIVSSWSNNMQENLFLIVRFKCQMISVKYCLANESIATEAYTPSRMLEKYIFCKEEV